MSQKRSKSQGRSGEGAGQRPGQLAGGQRSGASCLQAGPLALSSP